MTASLRIIPTSAAPNRTELVARAYALKPLLRANTTRAETLRRVPDDVLQALHAAGVFRMCQPKRYGGSGYCKTIIHDVCSVLAQACPSTSWVVGNLASHATFLAGFSERAQDEVWADPNTQLGSSFIFPAGRARRVEGGWLVSGRWPYSSGIQACAWCAVGAAIEDDDGTVGIGDASRQAYFLLTRDQYEILDTWYVAGLRGTGSTDLSAANAFVPDHRMLLQRAMLDGTAPGLSVNSGSEYRAPMVSIGGYVLLATLYGAAKGAVDHLTEELRSKAARLSGKPQSGVEAVQMALAEAAAYVDTVDMIARANLAAVEHALSDGEALSPALALRVRRDSSFAAQLCVAAVDLAMKAGGGTALFESNPVQRAWRDVHAGAAHVGLQWSGVSAAYGRYMMGLPSGLPGLGA